MIRFLQTPGKTKKIVLGGLLVVICGAMVVTLVPGGMLGDAFGFGSMEQGVLAKIGSEQVTTNDVDQTARRIGQQTFRGGNIPSQYLPIFKKNAADQLITQKALIVEAERMGFKVTDQELRDTLSKGQYGQLLFPNGQYIGDDRYAQFINDQFQMSIPQFQEALKTSILLKKLESAVEGPITVSGLDVADEYRHQNTKVKFDYALLTLDDVMKTVNLSEADVKAFYDSHKQEFANSIPEKREVRYIVVSDVAVASQIQVTDAELQSYYRSHEDQYRVPEQVDVSHILIRTPTPGPDGKTDPNAVKAAEKKAEDVLAKVKAGGNFADLAKQYSEDDASKVNGGSLGWIKRGATVPEFEKAAFSLKKGETSGIVQSSFGFHIIHINDKQDAHLEPFDQVKGEIEQAEKRDKAADVAQQLALKVESQAKTGSLDQAAQSNQLQVMTSNYVTSSDTLPGVGMAPQLMAAIFGATANVTDSVSTPSGTVIYQVTNIKPRSTPSFEEVRARVEAELKGDRAQTLLVQKTKELADKAKADHDLKKAAKEVGATVKTSDPVTTAGQVPDLGSMGGPASVAFTLKPGEISGPINGGRFGAVIDLLDRQEPAADEITKGSDQLREAMLNRKRQDAFQLFASSLRKTMENNGKIHINQEEYNKIAGSKSDLGF
jgi:peptidyl-prolyl cis-trans isomerase D